MDDQEKRDTPLAPDHGKYESKIEIAQAGVNEARAALKDSFTEVVENQEVIDDVGNLIRPLPHSEFVKGFPLKSHYNPDILGYRTFEGKVAIDADEMVSVDHAFQVAYHELLEELSARLGTHLRSFHKIHDGIIQYFVRKVTKQQGRAYFPTAYEGIADIVARLIDKGVGEELWKRALVDNQVLPELIDTTNKVMGNKIGFRKIDWALDEGDLEKAKRLVE